MASVDRGVIRKILVENGVSAKRTDDTISLMEPFYRMAEVGRYGLCEVSEIIERRAEEAIALVTGKEVNGIIFVSIKESFPEPKRMTTPVACEVSLKASLMDSFWDSFKFSLSDRLRASLRASLKASFRDSFSDSLGVGLWVSLFYYYGFTLVHAQENAERLTPLIQLLPYAIPFGEKKGEPGVWLVAVA